MLPSFEEYCALLADVPRRSQSIQSSTLRAFTLSRLTAEVEGEVQFDGGYVLVVWELVDLAQGRIANYSYELDRHGERVWWYDPMEHPEDPFLRSTFPHHKHIGPNIKHHRVPAPLLSFTEPNLPFLLSEVAALVVAG
jgi:hypothetical protein